MSEPGSSAAQGDRAKATKSVDAFRTISEVSDELNVPQHVLRFWESKFTQVNPLKRGGGRRYYRPDDIRILERIRDLLYVDGFTIKGVQRLLREHGLRAVLDGKPGAAQVSGSAPPSGPGQQEAQEEKILPQARQATQSSGSGSERRAIQAAIAELSEIRKLLSPVVE